MHPMRCRVKERSNPSFPTLVPFKWKYTREKAPYGFQLVEILVHRFSFTAMGWEAIFLEDKKGSSILQWTPIRLLKFNVEGCSSVNLCKMDLQGGIKDDSGLLIELIIRPLHLASY